MSQYSFYFMIKCAAHVYRLRQCYYVTPTMVRGKELEKTKGPLINP